MYINCLDTSPVIINDFEIKKTHKLTYLVVTFTDDSDLEPEINKRFNRTAHIFSHKALSISTKTTSYKVVVVPTLQYESETWSTQTKHLHVL